MTAAIAHLIDEFEAKKLTRRQLVASLAALVAGLASPAAAQTALVGQVVQGRTLNHASLAVTDVERSAEFYSKLLGLKVVSRPGNGGINLGLGTSFLGLYKLQNTGTVNHICLGVDGYDPDQIASRMQQMGIRANVDRNPANRTSGGDQLYFNDPDNTRIQLSANGYQG